MWKAASVFGETSALSLLPAALLKIQGMNLGLHPCTAAEGSCPPVHRYGEGEFVAVCSCFCALMMSNKEKLACKAQHTEIEVFFTNWESWWVFGHTWDVVLSSSTQCSPAVTAEQRHYMATFYQNSQEGSLAARTCPHTDPLQRTSTKFLCGHLYFSLGYACSTQAVKAVLIYWDSRHSWFKQSSSKHTFHCTGLRSHPEKGVFSWWGNCSILVISH